MNRVIRSFTKFSNQLQDEIYELYYEGELERTSFPYKGIIVDGVIYKTTEEMFLVPISTITSSRSSAYFENEDEVDDRDSEDVDTPETPVLDEE